VWTNRRGERMHGAGRLQFTHSNLAGSMWRALAYRTQEAAWRSLLPVFLHMERSYQPGSLAPGPAATPSPTPTP
jgi:hypothetical protein